MARALSRVDRESQPVRSSYDPTTHRALWALGSFALFLLIGFAIYGPALHGPFIDDDHHYLVGHPYTGTVSLANIIEILNPSGPAKLYAANYSPVHLLFCMAERAIFGDATFAYHVVNIVIHAFNCSLLVALLIRSGIPRSAAMIGGLIFAAHPANVETVAWISQLKTLAAFSFGMSALLWWRQRPGIATILFALALLTKYLALSLILVAAAFAWTRRGRPENVHSGRWLGVWAVLGLLVTIPQVEAFTHGGAFEVAAFTDPFVHLRTVAAIGVRYIAMALTGYGVAALHEPEPVVAWTNRWWLLSIPLGAVLLWRLTQSLRARREEGAWWVLAAASFGPISQVFPFFYGMGDRYLYFILPGLIGGGLLYAGTFEPYTGAGSRQSLSIVGRFAAGFAVLMVVFFALQSRGRAILWSHPDYVYSDAARAYPRGSTALYIRAVKAAHSGDTQGAIAALREAERGRPLSHVRNIANDPRLSALFDEPEFAEYIKEIATTRIELARRGGYDDAYWLRSVGSAFEALGEYDKAIEHYDRAIRLDAPNRSGVLLDLERVMELRRRTRAGGSEHPAARPGGG